MLRSLLLRGKVWATSGLFVGSRTPRTLLACLCLWERDNEPTHEILRPVPVVPYYIDEHFKICSRPGPLLLSIIVKDTQTKSMV
ncbi:hypothetical protein BU25DRAFT_2945 [Macroventuria anomochaeta]|uniref:Uncharacterized protein n=1 Tax=Macroventuria anomochaeta TaxID=301207 RepID=A0ACB6SGZ9_9PLEO|nr:uncharacterized protein BU25DRAFT_2945 [Macroventuria anomochaeta]KAF2633273.1 hypothetical protein BU25DRAFT_2945 [Macroventuria anomochaeta]